MNITHLTLINSMFLNRMKWEILDNLIYLDIESNTMKPVSNETGLKISSLNKNIRYIRIAGAIGLNTDDISSDHAIGFPRLETFKIRSFFLG